GLVKEEELGVAVRLHHLAMAALERQHAGDPGAARPAASAEALLGVVQPPAAVAHQRPALRRGDDLAERRDAVLQRHYSAAAGSAASSSGGARPISFAGFTLSITSMS